jgi:hypothetical protein
VADTLVTVGPNGAQEWSHFEQTLGSGKSIPTVLPLPGADWLGAPLVATGWVTGESRPRIVGCMSDLRSIRTLRYSAVAGGWQYVDASIPLSPPLAADAIVVDLALVDFLGNGLPKLVILTRTSLSVYELSSGAGVVQYTGNPGWTNVCMAVGSEWDGGPEWVAVVVNHPDGIKQYLTTIDIGGPNPALYLQGDPRVVAMDAGSYKDEAGLGSTPGTVDLILSLDSTNKLWILLNEPNASGPAFSLSSTRKLVLTYPSPSTGVQGNEATPVLEDADHDGDLDVLFPVRLTSSLHVNLNQQVIEDKQRPKIPVPGATTTTQVPSIYSAPDSSLSLGVLVDPAGTVPSGATHLELAVFRKETISSKTERVSAWSVRIPLPLGSAYHDLALPNPVPSPAGVLPLSPSNVARFENFFIVLKRYVKLVNGDVVRAFPGSFHGLETSAFPNNELYMESFTPSVELKCFYGGCPGCQTGDEIGTLTLLPSMPTPPDGPVIVQ